MYKDIINQNNSGGQQTKSAFRDAVVTVRFCVNVSQSIDARFCVLGVKQTFYTHCLVDRLGRRLHVLVAHRHHDKSAHKQRHKYCIKERNERRFVAKMKLRYENDNQIAECSRLEKCRQQNALHRCCYKRDYQRWHRNI